MLILFGLVIVVLGAITTISGGSDLRSRIHNESNWNFVKTDLQAQMDLLQLFGGIILIIVALIFLGIGGHDITVSMGGM